MPSTTPMRIPWRGIVGSVTGRPPPPTARFIAPVTTTSRRIDGTAQRRYATDSSPEPPTEKPSSATPTTSPTAPSSTTSNPLSDLPSFTSPSLLSPSPSSPPTDTEIDPRLPRAVQAAYLRPLRRQAKYGVPSCDLQLRSYSIRNLEFFADFCMRAAYYLALPAYGPVPLPRITERWTVPKGHFIHKKSQENFERKTLRRLIQIKDGNPETVEIWLAFIQKHAYYGIGMKANVWAFEKLGVGAQMDAEMERMRGEVDDTLSQFAFKKDSTIEDKVLEIVNREEFRAASGFSAPMLRPPVEKVAKYARTTKGVQK